MLNATYALVTIEKTNVFLVRRHLYLDPKRETERWYNPQPASQRLVSISNNSTKAVHVILGEPGGGKTTLLSQWAHDAYDNYQANPSSAPFPIYMRLRELHKYEKKSQSKNETLQYHYQQRKTKFFDLMPFIQGKAKALWFFDGWDELPEEAHAHWAEYIDDVAGQKIVSCRVLRYQQDFARFGTRQEYLIYGLNRQQQSEYLQRILPSLQDNPDHAHADSAWINTLLNKLHQQEHSNLRQLAISPLLLKLIAETNPPNAIKLPNTRSDFYDVAISNMLKREQRLEKLGRLTERKFKNALAEIAHHAGLEFNFSAALLTDGLESLCGEDDTKAKQLEDDFINCGILQQVGDSYEFLHATFHEWALAHYLAQQDNPLVNAVKNYWRDPSYDEVIALLWTHDKVDDGQREKATYFLMEAGCKKQVGSMRRRSGLKQSVVFWDYAGTQMPDAIAQKIWYKIQHNVWIKISLATISSKQNFLLTALSEDSRPYVKYKLAENLNISEQIMERLAADESEHVRENLAGNLNISQWVMTKLAEDESVSVRVILSRNPSISQYIRQELAKDTSREVRDAINQGLSNSEIADIFLKRHEDNSIDSQHARNPNISEKVMLQLAKHTDYRVRENLARNPNISEKVMLQLVNDPYDEVLVGLAENPNIPQQVMLQLAQYDKDWPHYFVQGVLAGNPNVPDDIMFLLTKHERDDIRRWVAQNHNISLYIMNVIASNRNSEAITDLAENPHVCWEVFLRYSEG